MSPDTGARVSTLAGVLLALDTSTAVVSVAVLDDHGAVLAQAGVEAGQKHGETLAPLVRAVLAEAGVPLAAVTRVVVGVGPGPFTGLRVGMVTAVALGSALGVPVVGVCSLDGLLTPGDGADVLAVTDARRKEVYWARYRDGERVAGPARWRSPRAGGAAARRAGRRWSARGRTCTPRCSPRPG